MRRRPHDRELSSPECHRQSVLRACIRDLRPVALYNDSELRRLDFTTGSEETIKHQNANGIRSIAFSPDGRLALVGGEWTPLTLIEVASGEAAFEFQPLAQRPPPMPSPYRLTARPP